METKNTVCYIQVINEFAINEVCCIGFFVINKTFKKATKKQIKAMLTDSVINSICNASEYFPKI